MKFETLINIKSVTSIQIFMIKVTEFFDIVLDEVQSSNYKFQIRLKIDFIEKNKTSDFLGGFRKFGDAL